MSGLMFRRTVTRLPVNCNADYGIAGLPIVAGMPRKGPMR
jgi:hypothetical protein